MDNEPPGVIEFWMGVVIVLVAVVWMILFVLVASALAKENDPPGSVSESSCRIRIERYLREVQPDALRFHPDTISWLLTGVTGERRKLSLGRLATFDLVRLYYRQGEQMDYGWIALKMNTPGGASVSALGEGVSPWVFYPATQQPGGVLLTLQLKGPGISAEGVDCDGDTSIFCQVEGLRLPGMSGTFINGGKLQKDPINGFLFWQVTGVERLDLCVEEG